MSKESVGCTVVSPDLKESIPERKRKLKMRKKR